MATAMVAVGAAEDEAGAAEEGAMVTETVVAEEVAAGAVEGVMIVDIMVPAPLLVEGEVGVGVWGRPLRRLGVVPRSQLLLLMVVLRPVAPPPHMPLRPNMLARLQVPSSLYIYARSRMYS